jgi:EmrB/QacA subfamily drug resistance transporter
MLQVTGPDQAAIGYGSGRGRWILFATVLASGMAQLDGTVVNVALPRIGTDLHAGLTSLQWIVNAYTLTLAGLLLLGGSLGDRLGRRKIFVIGVLWFSVASLGCALAPNAQTLIALRAVQGVGGALLTPGSLAILQAVFVPADRSTAVGAWSGLAGVASAIGPVVGGLLVSAAPWGWRLVFLINLPLAGGVLLASRHIPETKDAKSSGRLDVRGASMAALGLAGLVYGLTEGASNGWQAGSVAATAAGLVMLILFGYVEGRLQHPMLPPRLFTSRQFTAANLVTFVIYAAFGGMLFLIPVELQRGVGFSPVASGAALLPVTVVMLLLSPRMGRLAAKRGPRLPMTIGPIVAGAGLALLMRVGPHASYLSDVFPGVLVFALGVSILVAPLTATVLAAAPVDDVGVASAVNNDVARTGGLLAVAVLPALAGISATSYHSATALSQGFHHAALICAAMCVTGGVLSMLCIRTQLATVAAD